MAGETLLLVIWCEIWPDDPQTLVSNWTRSIYLLIFRRLTSTSDSSSTSASGLLCRATTWYVDVTFKLCRIPFTQLLFINVFVKRSELAEQVYFLFIFMTGGKYLNFRDMVEDPRINFRTLFNYKCYIK